MIRLLYDGQLPARNRSGYREAFAWSKCLPERCTKLWRTVQRRFQTDASPGEVLLVHWPFRWAVWRYGAFGTGKRF
jgi:hypothetical protein